MDHDPELSTIFRGCQRGNVPARKEVTVGVETRLAHRNSPEEAE